MEYNFAEIERKWQYQWSKDNVYKVNNPLPGEKAKPKYYILDMFPYPSGSGLHVGHPLGYIASDIYSRYKRLKGYNVLHPMGFDSFGLPAEQYALETGRHPAITTEKNISTFKKQLDKIGFCYDWEREVRTSNPAYYKWTQWIFLKLFNSYFCNTQQKARPIEDLIKKYESQGTNHFTADEWNAYTHAEQSAILMKRRLAFSAYGEVNWCEALGTVLANDEVVNGVSERGGHPVVKKKMRQWYLRITAYADGLLNGLEHVQFSESMKEMQRNWIGKSEGAEIEFRIARDLPGQPGENHSINKDGQVREEVLKVYTTRPDTIFGVDFLVLAPEHELVNVITDNNQRESIDEYISYVKSRSDRERMAEVKQVTGCFTGAFAVHPFSGKLIPIWIAEYVLAGYGTGAIMAVPCGDARDFAFAKHFNLPVTNIIGNHFNGEEANPTKEAVLQHSKFLDGLLMKDAIGIAINRIEEAGIGKRRVNYRMRDAGFSRQRYWGEPFPIVWIDGIAIPLDENKLPLELPYVEKYGPGPDGEGPLANLKEWTSSPNLFQKAEKNEFSNETKRDIQELCKGVRETSTMPGYAGSSWYFLRYMDPKNDETFCDRSISDYWSQVDVYVGGTEHAVGHLLYSRMWTKVLYDLNLIGFDEPFRKLVNQGMIQGSSRFVYRLDLLDVEKGNEKQIFISKNIVTSIGQSKDGFNKLLRLIEHDFPFYISNIDLKNVEYLVSPIHADVNMVNGLELDIEKFRSWKPEFKESIFLCEDGTLNVPLSFGHEIKSGIYLCGAEVEKMSKSKYNTVNPDDLVDKYGADTFRMYEMFLGPVEASKPWDTKGIEGVHRFLRKLWRLFFDEIKGKVWTEDKATGAELKVLHKTIKKIESDTESFSFNTAVSAFMICINELADLKCYKKEILEQVLVLLVPYAPHISEELWHQLGNEGTILDAAYPVAEEKYLAETSKEYPISINGKLRTTISMDIEATQSEVEKIVQENDIVQKWLEGGSPKKIIFVKGKMVNVVI